MTDMKPLVRAAFLEGRKAFAPAAVLEDRERTERDWAASEACAAIGALLPKDVFITATSGDGKPYVQIRFQSLKEMQGYHDVLVKALSGAPT